MAIGTSPCPPFNNRAGLPPGVLWDGNTVAWYKYNDPVAGVVKDGANRVSVWFDKFNYLVQPSIVPAPNFNNGVWVPTGAVIVSDTNFTNAAGIGYITNANYLWTVGRTYHFKITVRVTAGITLTLSDRNFANTYWTYVGTGGFQSFDLYFTVGAIGVNGIMLRAVGVYSVDVTSWSIEPVVGNHLLQYTGANQPLWSAANGVLFDGVNDYMKTSIFVYNQPEILYLVLRHITWTLNDRFFDGNNSNTGQVQQINISPQIAAYSGGAFTPNNANLILNTFGILRVLFNGVTSFLQVNTTAPSVNNTGPSNMGGFTLASQGVPGGYGNIECKEIILRRSADAAGVQADIYNYLKNANAVP